MPSRPVVQLFILALGLTMVYLFPPPQVIRELREELEKLRALVQSGVGGEGGGGVNPKEMAALQEKLRISEGLMAEMTKTWEQKLADTERIHQVREGVLLYQ